MPRNARTKSESGRYHIMLRGINKQVIFAEDEDRRKFLSILLQSKEKSGCKIYAYCLMGNHIHLFLEEGQEPIENTMKRIGSQYVYWYNLKYSRTGHLFQDRFKSEPVDDSEYFYTVIRYIHQNPVKAGLSEGLEYPFSSFSDYLEPEKSELVDTEVPLTGISYDDFIKTQYENSSDLCLDVPESFPVARVTDEQAQVIIRKISRTDNINEFQLLPPEVQAKNILKCRKKGVSIRQLSRFTGVSKGIIEKIGKENR